MLLRGDKHKHASIGTEVIQAAVEDEYMKWGWMRNKYKNPS